MRLVFPNAHRINRGNYVVKELAEACRANDVTDLVIVHEHRGTPGSLDPPPTHLKTLTHLYPLDALIVSHFPHGPTAFFTLNNVSLRHVITLFESSFGTGKRYLKISLIRYPSLLLNPSNMR